MLSTFIAFLGACTLIAASPGPSTVLIIRQSLASRRAGLMTVLGNETGIFIWGLAAAFGLTGLLAASEVAYDVMRITGAVVLVGFGVQTLRAARRARREGEGQEPGPAAEEAVVAPAPRGRGSGWRSYRAGLVMNLANPKAAVFALSFLPQFVPSGAPKLPTMVVLAAVWAVYEIGYYSVYVWGVSRMKRLLSRAVVRRGMERVSGGVLVALGIRMAVEG
ncbi:LysE family translocator [Streptomyces sp. NA02950]|uniref:LysE family translocator n=1 Tax=Streptomyces sp. NA02950 TaxID=2742137 RepID=UPI001590B115|nr:LysE family translocator [Streptomyces sp. NA02950]QKV92020.1 LysE family translocator [Streptomyces sp. NA02950]